MKAYYLSATLARLGDEMVALSLILLIIHRVHDTGLAGLTTAAYSLPALVTGPLLGSWLDGTRHRRAVLAANQVALAVAMIGILATPSWAAPAFAVLAGLAVPMTSAGFSGLMPRLVAPERLTRANSLDSLSYSAAAMGGPALVGVTASLFTPAGSVLAIAVMATGSLVALAFMPAVAPSATGRKSVRDGFRHIVTTPELRGVTLATTVSYGVFGMLMIALPIRTGQFGLGDSSGYVLAAVEIGCVITNFAGMRYQNRWQTVLVSLALYGIVLGSWPLAGSFAVLLVCALVTGLAQGGGFPALLNARQRFSPPDLLSQVGTTGASLKIGAFAVGSALGGQLVTVLGASNLLAVVAVAQVLAAVLGWLVSRRPRVRGDVATADRQPSA